MKKRALRYVLIIVTVRLMLRNIASTPKCILSVFFEMACTVRFAKANTKKNITFYVDEVCKLVVIGMNFLF